VIIIFYLWIGSLCQCCCVCCCFKSVKRSRKKSATKFQKGCGITWFLIIYVGFL
jgi:hypothetical protein